MASQTSTAPRFLARIGASIFAKSPATTTITLSGVSLLAATRFTSSGVTADSFSRYQSYFQDRQNVLAHESEKLQQYELLTQRRSIDLYNTVRAANAFLIGWGMVFLTATLVLSILATVGVVDHWQLAAITGGLSLAQFVGAFFTQPTSDLQRNLTNLATFKMILESHSLKTAVARYHLTTPQALRELQTKAEAEAAARQVAALKEELAAIGDVDRADFEALEKLGFGGNGRAAAEVGQVLAAAGEPAAAEGGTGAELPAEQ